MFLKLYMSMYFHNFEIKLKYLISPKPTSQQVSRAWCKTHCCSLQIHFQFRRCIDLSLVSLHFIKSHRWVRLSMNIVFSINDLSPHSFFLYVYEVLIWSLLKPRHGGKFSYGVHKLPGRMCRTGGCTKGI